MAYDSSKTAFSWGGVAAKGVADGEWINWDVPNDEVTSYVGTRGEGSNVVSPDTRCTITVTLQADSPTNAQWEVLRATRFEGPALLRDRSSTELLAFAQQAMVTKQPSQSRSRDKPVIEWVFTAPACTVTPLALAL